MKIRHICLLAVFAAYSIHGQYVLIKFYPYNQPYAGLTNYPMVSERVSYSTNVDGWSTNMTVADYNALVANLTPIYNAGASNALYLSTGNVNSNYVAWYSIYTNIPAGITDSSNRMATFNSLISSWSSGTNTAAGTNLIIKQTLQQDYYTWVYLNQIIGYLSRLGPGFQQIYQPASDPIGH